ncbi:MAG TPA: VOC family protein [Pseudolabrys sp.]|nr:VOC family protein [Pseudolabrys sp.]
MPRGLDHIVHAVRDLDAAAELYRRLGFTVGARNKHPWGTHNHIVQLPGFFIELLTLAEPDKLGDDGFSTMFAAHNRDFIARGDGLSLLILESQSAQVDEAAFRAAGIAASEVMRFEREGKRPDGTPVKVGFSLAFAEDKDAPDIHFCICQQHFPENFWNPAFQKHANGVQGVAGVVMVADEPERHRSFMLAYTGSTNTRADGDGFVIDLPRGAIAMMTPSAFVRRFGAAAPDTSRGARLAALRFAVRDRAAVQKALEQAGITAAGAGGTLIVGPQAAMGAVLVFEASR